MPETHLVADLVAAIVAAFVGGLVAQRLRLPVILGYLVAGVAIGPAGLGTVHDVGNVQVLAEVGVAFLMFALGAEFSAADLRRFGPPASVGGTAQLLLTAVLGTAVGLGLGLDTRTSLLVGALLALSSTVVALKLLEARGEASSLHGRLAAGLAIVQDVAVVPLVILLPALSGGADTLWQDVLLTVAEGALLVALAFVAGTRVVPLLLERAATGGSREMFLLGTVSLVLGTAVAAEWVGLSAAFGAFLAGLVVSGSVYAHQVVAEVVPLRDLFASLFFASVGMLVNVGGLAAGLGTVAALLAVATVGKALIVAVLLRGLGMPGPVSLMAGLALGQVGELSFVLARVAVDQGVLSAAVFDLVLATALLSIALSPLLLASGPLLVRVLAPVPVAGKLVEQPNPGPEVADDWMRGHVVICGFGRIGHELATVLRARGIGFEVIEYNPRVVAELQREGIRAIYGDAANPAVLAHTGLDRARVLAVTVPDASEAERIVRFGRSTNPRLDILARSQSRADIRRLRGAGASDVVQPEFEGGVEFIRHTMRRYGVLGTELQALSAGRRAAYYEHGMEGEL